MASETITQDSASYLNERDWHNLIRDIHSGQVLPVIGPELVTIPGDDGKETTLYSYLAKKLAQKRKIDISAIKEPALNEVACKVLLSGTSNKDLYDDVRDIVDELFKDRDKKELVVPLPEALINLASILDFNLYITTTFDPIMCKVLKDIRPGFSEEGNTMDFHPSKPSDLIEPVPRPFLFNILGKHDTYPDFAVWEEDYIEYLCGLLRLQDNLRILFGKLRNMDLLLMGSPFSDWIVRLFLRIAKGKRFSQPRSDQRFDYVADDPKNIKQPTIFFFQQKVGSTLIIPGDPCLFIKELAKKWREQYCVEIGEDILEHMSDDMPKGSVFISYSRDDLEAATRFARGLMASQIPVWMDKGRITAGENYARSLEHAIKNEASFFISLISKTTESDPKRYVRTEREWAAQRHVDGFVFYIPVLIDEIPEIKNEPVVFEKIHRDMMQGGNITPAFSERIHNLIEEYCQSGRPRG